MILEWTEDIAIGVEVVDVQHKALFETLNSLVEAIDNNSGDKEVEGILDFLDGYVLEHFEMEENMMKEVSCPEMDKHIAQHHIFRKSLAEIKQAYRSEGATNELLLMLKSNLCNWLFSHIMMVDRRMGIFLKG
jgi:hemerythrin